MTIVNFTLTCFQVVNLRSFNKFIKNISFIAYVEEENIWEIFLVVFEKQTKKLKRILIITKIRLCHQFLDTNLRLGLF